MVKKQPNFELLDIRLREVLDYLKQEHEILRDDYKTKDGHTEVCGLVAREIAKKLILLGENPTIIRIIGTQIDSVNTKPIEPRLYKGKVSWGAHLTVLNKGQVYDPMVGHPMPLGNYLANVFTEPVEYKTQFSEDETMNFIK